jgi:WD40 repeat protein
MKAQINTEYIHDKCINDLCYSSNGKSIITVSDDYKIIIKNLNNKDNLKILSNHLKEVTTIDLFEGNFVTGSKDGTAMLFEYPSGKCEQIISHFNLPVQCVCFSSDGKKVAIASDELKIRVINIFDITDLITIENFNNKIKSIQFDPSGKFLIGIDTIGTIKIWNISNSEPTLVNNNHNIIGLVSKNNQEKCNISWQSDKRCFAIPGNNNNILVFSGTDWSLLYKFENNTNELTNHITSVAWSINGLYIAATDNSSNIIIWRTQDKKLLVKYHHSFQPIKLAWNPMDNDLAFVDYEGNLSIWSDVKQYLDSLNENSSFPININEEENVDHNISENIIKDDKNSINELFNLFEDIEAEEDLTVKESPSINNDIKMKSAKEPINDNNKNEEEVEISENSYESDEGVDDFVVDDDGAGYSERGYDAPISLRKIRSGHKRKTVRFDNEENRPNYSIIDSQEAFQPGSTPLLTSSGGTSNKKYLAFNMLGSIYSIRHDDELFTIHVEYHDRSILRPYSFSNNRNYSMASLCEHGAVFAYEGNKENNLKSTLYFKPVETWATKSDWYLELNDDENIKAVALTNKGIVVATDKKYLRFFTFSGFQLQILSIKGKIVSMIGSSMNNQFFIVYQSGNVFNGDQSLMYMFYDADISKVIKKDELPISQNSTLEWIGFTEYGIPATYDSEGVGRILVKHIDYQWIPVIDTSSINKSKDDEPIATQISETKYWVVSMTEKHLLCVILKGSDHYLQFQKPIVSEINLQVPLLQLETQDGIFEERIYRTKLFMNINRDKNNEIIDEDVEDPKYAKEDLELDKLLLTLIMNSCKEGNIQRALDLTSSLRLTASVEKAVLIAIRFRLSSLAERIQLIQEAKEKKQKERELKKISKNRMNNHRDFTDFSDDEPNSPELLEMTEDYNNNDNDHNNDNTTTSTSTTTTNINSTSNINYIKKGNIIKKDISVKKHLNKNIFGKKKIFNQNNKSTDENKKNPFAVEIKSPKLQHTSKTLFDALEKVKNEKLEKVKKRKQILSQASSSEDSLSEKRIKTVNSSIEKYISNDITKKAAKNMSTKNNILDNESSSNNVSNREDESMEENDNDKLLEENIDSEPNLINRSNEKPKSTVESKHAILEKFKFKGK